MDVYRVAYFSKTGESKGFDYFLGSVIARVAVKRAEEREEKAATPLLQIYSLEIT